MGTVDLSFDGGEGFDDAALLPFVSTVHVACGGHAGDEESMRRLVRLASDAGVALGAHPGYPDRAGFGRMEMNLPPGVLAEEVRTQVAALVRIASDHGARVVSVKPHGALYHRVARDLEAARALARAVSRLLPGAALVTLPNSALHQAGREVACPVHGEAFADRRYAPDGGLVSRSDAAALIESPEEAARQALSIARDGVVVTSGGALFPVSARTLCVHGDTPGAPRIAAAVRRALEDAGFEVTASV